MNLETILRILDIKEDLTIDEILDTLIIYLRKSRKDMDYYKDESIEKTLQRHEKELQDYIISIFGKPIAEKNIYREVASGDTIEDRPVMQEVLSLVESYKYKAVVCIEIERLARGNSIDQGIIAQTFLYTKTKIMTPMKIYDLDNDDDLTYFEDGLFQSRKFLKYTKKILNRGRVRSVKEGKYIGSILPYGYDKEKLENEKGFILIIKPDEAAVIKLMAGLYLNGLDLNYEIKENDTISSIAKKFGVTQEKINKDNPFSNFEEKDIIKIKIKDMRAPNIANYLNFLKIKPAKNEFWTANAVRNILTSYPVYGYLTWNHKKIVPNLVNGKVIKKTIRNKDFTLIKGKHEAILSEETGKKIQEKMQKIKYLTAPYDNVIKNPLSGLVKCGYCGNSMTRRPYNKNYQNSNKPPQKPGLICNNKNCQCVGSNLDLVENRVITSLKALLNEYVSCIQDFEYNQEHEKKQKVNSLKIIDNNINKINTQINKACELVETGAYTQDLFNLRIKTLTEQKEALESQKTLLNEYDDFEKNLESKKRSIPILENILDNYNDLLSAEEKNIYLSKIIDKIVYKKNKGGRGYEDNFTIEISLKSLKK